MRKIALLVLLAVMPVFAQQPSPHFDVADVHVSSTARGFGQNFGGVLREGHYVNRDATMLELIEAAYGISEDNISGAVSLQQMANAYMDHPVVDATGLEGGWSFLMGWTPKAMMQGPTSSTSSTSPQGNNVAEVAVPDGITVFDAVEKELGLKLVAQKRSVPVIVVDHVDEKPLQ